MPALSACVGQRIGAEHPCQNSMAFAAWHSTARENLFTRRLFLCVLCSFIGKKNCVASKAKAVKAKGGTSNQQIYSLTFGINTGKLITQNFYFFITHPVVSAKILASVTAGPMSYSAPVTARLMLRRVRSERFWIVCKKARSRPSLSSRRRNLGACCGVCL